MMLVYDKETWRATVENGRIPLAMLDRVVPEQYDRDLEGPALMHPEAAAAMGTMLRQAAEDGFGDLAVSLSYRTYEMQVEKWANYQAGGNLAAQPGTSNHGWAVSGDMRWGRLVTLTWLKVHSPKYGFINDVASENWHYTFQEGLWNGDTKTKGERADMAFGEDMMQGAKDFRDGKPLKDAWTAARKFGYNNEKRIDAAAKSPKPAEHTHPPADHQHNLIGKAE